MAKLRVEGRGLILATFVQSSVIRKGIYTHSIADSDERGRTARGITRNFGALGRSGNPGEQRGMGVPSQRDDG